VTTPPRLRVGVSACLLGERVRYDGDHKRDAWLTGAAAERFELVPVCPEVELGMGVPRPPVRLQRFGGTTRLMRIEDGADLTASMRAYAEERVGDLRALALCGFVLKSRSPSCGRADAVLHDSAGRPIGTHDGVFAAALAALWPQLPTVTEAELADDVARAAFVERVEAFGSAGGGSRQTDR